MTNVSPVLIIGGGEIASAAALKIFNSGRRVVLYIDTREIELRYNITFADVVDHGQKTIQNVTASILSEDLLAGSSGQTFTARQREALSYLLSDRKIPVLYDMEFSKLLEVMAPGIVVNTLPSQTVWESGEHNFIIGMYPTHIPGKNCHLAIETRLNYQLGSIYHSETRDFPAGETDIHIFKNPFSTCPTPIEGNWISLKEIGDGIRYNEALGKINDIEIRSPYDGQIWGLVHSGKFVSAKAAVALIYEGLPNENFRSFGFRNHAIAAGVLEAVLQAENY